MGENQKATATAFDDTRVGQLKRIGDRLRAKANGNTTRAAAQAQHHGLHQERPQQIPCPDTDGQPQSDLACAPVRSVTDASMMFIIPTPR